MSVTTFWYQASTAYAACVSAISIIFDTASQGSQRDRTSFLYSPLIAGGAIKSLRLRAGQCLLLSQICQVVSHTTATQAHDKLHAQL